MASTSGRLARVVAGIVLIAVGLSAGGTGGWVLAIVGLVPLGAGAVDVCVFAPLAKLPFSGKEIRARVGGS